LRTREVDRMIVQQHLRLVGVPMKEQGVVAARQQCIDATAHGDSGRCRAQVCGRGQAHKPSRRRCGDELKAVAAKVTVERVDDRLRLAVRDVQPRRIDQDEIAVHRAQVDGIRTQPVLRARISSLTEQFECRDRKFPLDVQPERCAHNGFEAGARS
jgi:hypothetical protein